MSRGIRNRLEALEAVQQPDGGPKLIILTSPRPEPVPEVVGYRVDGKDWLAQDGESLAQLAKRILAAANGKHVIAGVIAKGDNHQGDD